MDTMLICQRCRAPLPATAVSNICAACQGEKSSQPPAASPVPHTITPPDPSEVSRRFPQLEIIELTGIGGMGLIYKARQPQLDRFVALKILPPELSSEPTFADRFSREAQALARLHHSNIVSIYDFGRADGYFYFLMEFVDGVNLYSLIHEKQLSPEQAQRIVVDVCQALQFAHDEGIIHRDIKPSNILVDKKGRVKIADFGLAKLVANRTDGAFSSAQPTLVMGTPNYMAPEQVERPLDVDHRADLYSLGVVFYEMLTYELPIGRFEPPSHKAKVDARLDEVVLRALEKEPKRRFQSATQIKVAVESLANGGQPALPPAPAPVAHNRFGWLRQMSLMTGSAILAVAIYLFVRGHWPVQSGRIPPSAVAALAAGPDNSVPRLKLFRELDLTPAQALEVNQVLRRTEQEFNRIERRHTDRTRDAQGHVHVTITPFPEEMKTLTDQMWSELSVTLTSNQLAAAHELRTDKLFPHSGTNTVKVELWQDTKGDYHFAEEEQTAKERPGNHRLSLPARFRSLLDEKPPRP